MNCPICQRKKLQIIFKLQDGPSMQHKLHNSLKSALNEKSALVNLYGCNHCGFVFNKNFEEDKTEYSSHYDNTQDYSPFFQKYLKEIALKLKNKYRLKNKNVVEVGCGKGHFLKILHDGGVKKVKGFDPSYINYDPEIDRLVVKSIFNKTNISEKVDFIICRHVLEHIGKPKEFIASIIECLKNNGSMYFEFPDLKWIVKNKTFFDFFYEHCNYFTKSSVQYLFHSFGFKVNFNYGLKGQYFKLIIEKGESRKREKIISFDVITKFLKNKIDYYKKYFRKIDNFAIWGAGAKGVTLLNRLGINNKLCKYVIDINPNKQNKFIPITGQKIVSPNILQKERFDTIIIMNPVYMKEIKLLASNYGYNGRFTSI